MCFRPYIEADEPVIEGVVMNNPEDRYDRNIRLFGKDGQERLRGTDITVIGAGGLGSMLIEQLAYLGVRRIFIVDPDMLDESNRNRLAGAKISDTVPGTFKVAIAARHVREINPDIEVIPLAVNLVSEAAFNAVRQGHIVFGCLDHDGPRFILNELCAAYSRPYVDLASDVPGPAIYGGRVYVNMDGAGCLHCHDILDATDVRRYLQSEREQAAIDAVYGIDRRVLGEVGPAVAPINGIVASIAALEFMVAVTGMRAPTRHINLRAHQSKVSVSIDSPVDDCPVCKGVRGLGAEADCERYLRIPHLNRDTKPAKELCDA